MTDDDASSLLQPVPPGGDWRKTAIIGGRGENDSVLAMGFLEAADILVDHWKARRPNDMLALPILALYRHAIELGLKVGIRGAAGCLRAGGAGEPDLQYAAVENRLSGTHSIGKLVAELNTCLGRLELGPDNQLPADTIEVLTSPQISVSAGEWTVAGLIILGGGSQVASGSVHRPERARTGAGGCHCAVSGGGATYVGRVFGAWAGLSAAVGSPRWGWAGLFADRVSRSGCVRWWPRR